jgi:hypothetical protein
MSLFGFIADVIWGVSEVFLFNERDRKIEQESRNPEVADAAGRDEQSPGDGEQPPPAS